MQTNTDWAGTEIAIVGAAGRFPGARTLDEFWAMLHEGRESIRLLTDAELDAAGVPPEVRTLPQYVRAAAVLDDIGWWDARFWGFSPKDAAIMDPQHRLFLECAYEALESAGIAPDRAPGRVGVYAGVGMGAWFQNVVLRNQALLDDVGLFLLRHTGNDKDFLATRVSYELDLHGPSVNVQTACSTSLVAMHLAAQSLLAGETDVALAGGVTIELPNTAGYLFRENEILSPDGHCRPFDAAAAGTVFGSGAGVVVLRRLQDALDDGDHILGVIRGTAINNDGAGKVGYLAPSVDGQADAIAEAIAMAGVPAESIGYVEAHGTGTRIGDPIEVEALTQAFRRSTSATGFCGLGSLKSNIGHLDTAAGVAGVLKVLLAMRHGEIPATVHFEAPNPLIDFARTPFVVSGKTRPWPTSGHPRRAGVSSLGVGGTNAHVIIEEPPAVEHVAVSETSPTWQLLPVSARSETACATMATNLADHLRDATDITLADAASTLQRGRLAHPHRAFVVATDAADAANRLDGTDTAFQGRGTHPGRSRSVAFQFAGGGAQHPDMARTLYERDAIFRAAFDEGLASLEGTVSAEIRRVMLDATSSPATPSPDAVAVLERPSIGLPALLITQIALARVWAHWGVQPAAMIGHSMGEYTAAHLAGVFTLHDVVRLVALRGALFEQVAAGAMLSVPMAPEVLAPLLPEGVAIGVVNAPQLCVASGPVAGIAALEALLTARGEESRRIRINVAAHSVLLDPILGRFEAFLRTITFGKPTVPFVSNRSGNWITPGEATSPEYWVRHLRETVHFASGLDVLLQDPDRVLLEVGPGRVLTQLATQHPSRRPTHALLTSMPAANEAGADDQAVLLTALGTLWSQGVEVEWAALHDQPRRRVPLPTYPWERQRYWLEADARPAASGGDAGSDTEGAGDVHASAADDARVGDVARWFHEPVWRRTGSVPVGERARRVWVLGERVPEVLGGALGVLLGGENGSSAASVDDRLVHFAMDRGEQARVDSARPIDGLSVSAWMAVFEQARAADALPTHIVHAWSLEPGALTPEESAFYTLASLGQALAQQDPPVPVTVSVLASEAVEVTGGDVRAPMAAMALGPALGLPAEVEACTARFIDLDAASMQGVALSAALAGDLAGAGESAVAAYRNGRRWVRTFRAVAPAANEALPDLPVQSGGTYLITGGLGGIGLTLARTLASRAPVRLVLWSRRGLTEGDAGPEARARRAAIASLEQLGATVEVQVVDVADPAQVRAAVRDLAARGAPRGVIHAAGVLADGLLSFKQRGDMAQVIAPKVHGLEALAEAVVASAPAGTLDFFVCCSSVSAMAGLPGQIDYAAANAYLDAWCARESARASWPVVSLAWSAWRDTGMVARTRQTSAGAAQHPLLEQSLRDGDQPLYGVLLDTSRHWMMDEHRLADGTSLVPGTGYLELARSVLEPWARGSVLELHDVAFFSPFVLDPQAARELRVAASLQDDRAEFVIAGRVTPGEDGSAWEEHVVGTARRGEATAPARLDLQTLRQTQGLTSVPPVPDPHLRFGPRWHNVREMFVGAGRAVLHLELPDAYHADLPTYALHPALMDMATAGAQCLIPGYEATRDFFVPLSYGRLRYFAPLPPRVISVVTLRSDEAGDPDLVAFDVTVCDADGRVLVEIEEFLMTRVRDHAQLTMGEGRRRRRRSTLDLDTEQPTGASEAEPAWYAEAIAPAEGEAAFVRGVQLGATHPHLLVSPFSLDGLLHRLRAPHAGPNGTRAGSRQAGRSAGAAAGAPVLPLHTIEEALRANAAVARAVVVQRADRTGSVRLVAYAHLAMGARATVSELRRGLKKVLPAHLVPSMFVMLDSWPVDHDGPVPLDVLPDPFGAQDDFVAPRSAAEQAIARVWRDVLGIEQISVRDNFFDIGGHSLLAVRAITRLEKAIGVRLNQANMVLQTLEQLAAECERRTPGSAS